MNTTRTLQVLTTARGTIIGAGLSTSAGPGDHDVQVAATPLKGQSLAEVTVPRGLRLETADDFRAFVAAYRVEKGTLVLTQVRRITRAATPGRRRPKR